jgi:hypothetical protein
MADGPILSRHYHVIENSPGYLPESDPLVTRSKREARAYAKTLAHDLREAGYRVAHNHQDGYSADRSPADCRVIEIIECCDAQCSPNAGRAAL